MLKTSGSTESKIRPGEGKVKVGGGKAGSERSELDGSKLDDSEVDGNEVEIDEIRKKVQKTSKSKNLSKFKKTLGSSDFFTFGAKLAFTELRQVFIKASILYHFYPKRHIWIETDVSGYIIGRVLSQLSSDDSSQ